MFHINLHMIVDRKAKIIWSWENLIRNAILKSSYWSLLIAGFGVAGSAFILRSIVEILSETLEGVDVKFMGVWEFQIYSVQFQKYSVTGGCNEAHDERDREHK